MMANRIVFATNNEHKMEEVRMILKDLNMEVLSLKEMNIDIDIVEDGNTFEENAVIKAKTIAKLTNEIVLADDSGLEVDYLNKAPGIYSARFLGENTSYTIKNKYIVDHLHDAVGNQRSARFVCAIACVFPDGSFITKEGVIEGEIAYEESGENGFGYDPIFFLPEYKLTTAQLLPEKKNEISHRGKALKLIKEELIRVINKSGV